MKLLAWDIETLPHEVYRWGFYDQSPVALNQVIKPGGVMSYAARWVDAPKSEIFYQDLRDGKEVMLQGIYNLIDEADGLVSWNGQKFDTKRINTEFVQLGWTPPAEAKEIDLMLAVKKRMAFPSNKLEYVANALLGKGKVQHEGFNLWLKCMAGDEAAWKRMGKYNQQDVHLLIELYNRLLPWVDTIPNHNLFDGFDGCAKCGSDHIQRRGYRYTRVSKFAKYVCLDCGGWSSVGKAEDRADVR
jgi:DNA polymerase elongation subunit (family B)